MKDVVSFILFKEERIALAQLSQRFRNNRKAQKGRTPPSARLGIGTQVT
jgi:hypothetical protein